MASRSRTEAKAGVSRGGNAHTVVSRSGLYLYLKTGC